MSTRTERADARRNRELVLDAARIVFGEGGLAAPLTEVATRAGVGVGTVYRHFPTKEALLGAVVDERVREMADRARALVAEVAAGADAGDAFFGLLREAVARAVVNAAMCEAIERTTGSPYPADAGGRERWHTALAELLALARAAGAVRADVDEADVGALIAGAITMAARHGDVARMTDLAGTALRPAAAGPTLVTKQRHESPPRQCAQCGRALPAMAMGRPARYCGAACRQRAHRAARGRGAGSPAETS